MTYKGATQKIAEVLQARAQDAGTDRGFAAYWRRAAYLLSIDTRLDERFDTVVDAAFRGEPVESISDIRL